MKDKGCKPKCYRGHGQKQNVRKVDASDRERDTFCSQVRWEQFTAVNELCSREHARPEERVDKDECDRGLESRRIGVIGNPSNKSSEDDQTAHRAEQAK